MSISTRIRPNSEAAPWVIEEVRKLEAEVDRLRPEIKRAYTDGARAMKAEMIRIVMGLTYDGDLWPELLLRLREASVGDK